MWGGGGWGGAVGMLLIKRKENYKRIYLPIMSTKKGEGYELLHNWYPRTFKLPSDPECFAHFEVSVDQVCPSATG